MFSTAAVVPLTTGEPILRSQCVRGQAYVEYTRVLQFEVGAELRAFAGAFAKTARRRMRNGRVSCYARPGRSAMDNSVRFVS
jgi:hypothetical protein